MARVDWMRSDAAVPLADRALVSKAARDVVHQRDSSSVLVGADFVDVALIPPEDRVVLFPKSDGASGASAYPEALRHYCDRSGVRMACVHMDIEKGVFLDSSPPSSRGVVSLIVLSRKEVFSHPDLAEDLMAFSGEEARGRFVTSCRRLNAADRRIVSLAMEPSSIPPMPPVEPVDLEGSVPSSSVSSFARRSSTTR